MKTNKLTMEENNTLQMQLDMHWYNVLLTGVAVSLEKKTYLGL